MPRVSFVNGRFVRHRQAGVHVEDRGYQFADAVYEVIAVAKGRMVDEGLHLERLERSLREIRMEMPFTAGIFRLRVAELLRLNRIVNGSLYLQVSRGVSPRNHRIPPAIRPSVVMTIRPMTPPSQEMFGRGVSVITVRDIRWRRPDIKSVALLPNVLAKDDAVRNDVFEAWQVDDGVVTEGTSTNAWIVSNGTLITHPPADAILNGITRLALVKLAEKEGAPIEERPFSVGEAMAADEAFLTSTSSFLLPVVEIDGKKIGKGTPGPVSRRMMELYNNHVWTEDA
jgi:D-alanine transaminase